MAELLEGIAKAGSWATWMGVFQPDDSPRKAVAFVAPSHPAQLPLGETGGGAADLLFVVVLILPFFLST